MDTIFQHLIFLIFTILGIRGDDKKLETSISSNSFMIKDSSSTEHTTDVPITLTLTTSTQTPYIIEPLLSPINLSTTLSSVLYLEPYEERETTVASPSPEYNDDNDTNLELNSRILLQNNSYVEYEILPFDHTDSQSNITVNQNDKHVIKLENITDVMENAMIYNDSLIIDSDIAFILEEYFGNNTNITLLENITYVIRNISEEISKEMLEEKDNKKENYTILESSTIPPLSERILKEIDAINTEINTEVLETPLGKNQLEDRDTQEHDVNIDPYGDTDVLTFIVDADNKTIADTEKKPQVSYNTASDLVVAIRSAVTQLSPRSLETMTQQQSTDGRSSFQKQSCSGNCAQASSSSVNGKTIKVESKDRRPQFTPIVHHEERSWGKKKGPILRCGKKGTKKSSESVILHTVNLQKLQRSRQKRGLASASATATAFAGFPGWGPGAAFANAEGKAFSQNEGNSIANGQASAISGGPGLSIANGQGTAFSNGPGAGNAIGQGQAISAGPGISMANGQGATYSDGNGPSIALGQGNSFSTGNGFSQADGRGTTFGSGPGMNIANGQGSSFSNGPGLSMAVGQGSTFTDENGFSLADGKGTALNAGSGLSLADGQGTVLSGDPGSYGMPNSMPNSDNLYNLPNNAMSNGLSNGYDPYGSVPNDPYSGYNQYALPNSGTSNGVPSGYDSYLPSYPTPSTVPAGYNPYSSPSGPKTNSMPTNYDQYNSPNNLASSNVPAGYDNYNYTVTPASTNVPTGFENYAPQSDNYNPYNYGIPNNTPYSNPPNSYHSFGLRKREIPIISEYNMPFPLSNKEMFGDKIHQLYKRTVMNNNIYGGGGYMIPNYVTYGMSNSASSSSNSYGMPNSNSYEIPDISEAYAALTDGIQDESEVASDMAVIVPYGISNNPTNGDVSSISNSDVSNSNVYKGPYNSYGATKSDASSENIYSNSYKIPTEIIPPINSYGESSDEKKYTAPSSNSYRPSGSDTQGAFGSYQSSTSPSYEAASGNSYGKPTLDATYGSSDDVEASDNTYTIPSTNAYSSTDSKSTSVNNYEISSGKSYGQSSLTPVQESPASNLYEVSEDTSKKDSYGIPSSEISSPKGYSGPANPSYGSQTVKEEPVKMSYGEASEENLSPYSIYGMSNDDATTIKEYAAPSVDSYNVKDTYSPVSYANDATNVAKNTDNYTPHDSSTIAPVTYGMADSASSSPDLYNSAEPAAVAPVDVSSNDYDYQSQSNGNIYGVPSTPNIYSSQDSETKTQNTYTANSYGLPSTNNKEASSNSESNSEYSPSSSSYGAASESSQTSDYSQSNGQSNYKPSVSSYNTPQNGQNQESASNAGIYGIIPNDDEDSADDNRNRNGKTDNYHSSASASASASSEVHVYGGGGSPSYGSSSSVSSSVSSNTADAKEYCWQVAVYINGKYKCGGSIIRRQWILTAAHCLEGVKASDVLVRLGESELTNGVSSNGQAIHVEVIKAHSHFNSIYGMYDHDLALLKLTTPAQLSDTVCLICLPGRSSEYFNNKKCTVTGYGSESLGGKPLNRLKEITVPIVPNKQCEQILQNSIKDFHMHGSFMCAGGESMKDTCSGDGGSPLICEAGEDIYVQVGLVAWGVGCGQEGIPAVYSNIFYFDQWIHDSIQEPIQDSIKY